MLSQGLVLLIAGMGIVFLFLTVLVLVMSVMGKIVPKFNYILPDDQPKKAPRVAAPASDDTALAIAIAVAARR